MVRTPTTRVPSPAFPVRRVHLPVKKKVWNATNVPRVIYNLNRNNQNVFQSNLAQSWPKEDLHRSSCHSGLKLTPLLHPDSQHVQREQKAAQYPMSHVKIALLEHPAHPVPPPAKPATKASLTTTTVVLVKIASKKRFKIKIQSRVRRALLVPPDGNNQTKVPRPASVSIGKPWQVAKTWNI
jgi:hypothetical protein